MDALEKLAEKNRAYSKHQENERYESYIALIMAIPMLLGIAIDSNLIESSENFNLWLYGLGVLLFGLPLAAFIGLTVFSRFTKLCCLIAAQIWFTYFWVFQMQSWLAFLPLLPAVVAVLAQFGAIKKAAQQQEKGI